MTTNTLTDAKIVTLQLRIMSALSFYRQRPEKEARRMAELLELAGAAASELQKRRKADSAEPFGYYSAEVPTILGQQGHANISRDCAGEYRFPLYATPRTQEVK